MREWLSTTVAVAVLPAGGEAGEEDAATTTTGAATTPLVLGCGIVVEPAQAAPAAPAVAGLVGVFETRVVLPSISVTFEEFS